VLWVAVPLLLAIGATLVAFLGSDAAPFLDYVALVAAIGLGLASLATATREIEGAKTATLLAHQPLLVPIHDASWLMEKDMKSHQPAEKAPPLQPVTGKSDYRFLVIDRTRSGGPPAWEVTLHLRNVGAGPGIIERAEVFNYGGVGTVVHGVSSVGVGETANLTGVMAAGGSAADREHAAERARNRVADWLTEAAQTSADSSASYVASRLQHGSPESLFFLEVEYDDVFESPGRRLLRAFFDPETYGRWVALSEMRYRE
jgi:hypothetical protein